METNHDTHSGVFRVWSWAMPAFLLIAMFIVVCARPSSAATSDDCVTVNDGVSYTYVHDTAMASITLTPLKGPRCEDITVSMVGWKFTSPPAWWPQEVVETKTATLAKDATEPVTLTVAAQCQNDAYWGEAPPMGHVNIGPSTPWVEKMVNWHLLNGDGAVQDGPFYYTANKNENLPHCKAPVPAPPTPSSTVAPPVVPPVAAPPAAELPHGNDVVRPRPRSLPHTGN